MLEPNGPLPPEIYWRRRALAIGAAVVVLALIVWIVLSIGGGDDDSESTAAAATSELTESSEPPATSESADPSETSNAGSSSTTTSASSTTAANPSKDCADQSLALKVTPDQPQYKAGEEPGFTIAITNIGTNACERDLGSGLQQVLVYSLDGANRLWSNVDCFPSSEPEVRTLEPGGQARFTVKWSAKTSAPGCTAPREAVAPGGYTVVGQLGSLKSSPEPFNIA